MQQQLIEKKKKKATSLKESMEGDMGGLEGEKGRGNCIIILLSKTKQKPQTQGNLPYQTLTNKTKINHPLPQTNQTNSCRRR